MFVQHGQPFHVGQGCIIQLWRRQDMVNSVLFASVLPLMMCSSEERIYLDYNATTPVHAEVAQTISQALISDWGNPSSGHAAGVRAAKTIAEARQHVAKLVGATSKDIIFTSGGTEANNIVIHSAVQHFTKNDHFSKGDKPLPHIISSTIEHDSVKCVLEHLQQLKLIDVTFAGISRSTGQVSVDKIISFVRPTTVLITVMLANNETGVIQPVSEIANKIGVLNKQRREYCVLLHTDAAQALGKIPVDVEELNVDYLTVVGHKFYGPRIGALYVHDPGIVTPIYPMFYGGGQERGYRPGTENTAMIAGLGKAAELVLLNLEQYRTHMQNIKHYLEEKLNEEFSPENLHFNSDFGPVVEVLPNTCNVSVLHVGMSGSEILKRCRVLQASVGAACHEGRGASAVLLACGIPYDTALSALRLSVGLMTTKTDIDKIVADIKQAVELCKKCI